MRFQRFALGVLAGAMTCAVASGPAAAQNPLSYANHLSANHPVNLAMQAYFDRINSESGGSLTFEMFPGGALGGGRALLGLVRDGVADSGFINAIYAASALPASAGIAEFLHPDPRVLAAAQNEMFLLNCPECRKELAKMNAVPIMYYSTSSYYLLCNKPVTSLEQAQGIRVRAIGSQALMGIAFGMTPVNLTSDEVFEGLQRGQVDCAIAAPGWLIAYSLVDVTTDVLNMPTGAIGGLLHFAMNQSVWKGLPEEHKKLLRDGLGEAVADITFRYMAENEEALELIRSRGITLHEPDQSMVAKLKEFLDAETARITSKAKEAGVAKAEDLAKRYVELVEKWEGLVAEVGEDKAKYAEALNREIFSKIR